MYYPECNKEEDDEGQKISPPEDFIQTHDLLNRTLLIYDFRKIQLFNIKCNDVNYKNCVKSVFLL